MESQQVAQLVARPIEIVEYIRHYCPCQHCGTVASGNWSEEIIPGQDLGVRLQSLLTWLGNYGHLPYEKQQEFLWELGQIEVGVGTLVNTNARVAKASQPCVEQLRAWVKETHPNLHADETPWLVKGVKEWLWVLSHPLFCLFHAGDTREER